MTSDSTFFLDLMLFPSVSRHDPARRPERDSGKIILVALVVLCALLALSEFLFHKHTQFSFEELFAFHGVFGFLAYLAIVNAAKLLRLWVKRPEDYYND